ncbi:hypothetical protein ACIPJG_01420 [Streptomyces halstedii]|uniref:hypothetical protein n=1 Tax=Streptomyces halstedii TaxID=1944 RepID=UPI0037F19756
MSERISQTPSTSKIDHRITKAAAGASHLALVVTISRVHEIIFYLASVGEIHRSFPTRSVTTIEGAAGGHELIDRQPPPPAKRIQKNQPIG